MCAVCRARVRAYGLLLQVLDISCNVDISVLSEEFGGLRSLRRLVAHSCAITRIDDAIANVTGLEHLEVQRNKVRERALHQRRLSGRCTNGGYPEAAPSKAIRKLGIEKKNRASAVRCRRALQYSFTVS